LLEVLDRGLPTLRQVVHRNVVAVGFEPVGRVTAPLVMAVAAFDNLLKGAAGQAVQNANLMLGYEELEGIPQ
jgi:N-acetyl-gamma-glutamyl-phosphate reductase